MGVLAVGVVLYGFSFTIRDALLHPAFPLPTVLFVHAAVFFFWLLLFILQGSLVNARRADLHRRIGPVGLVLGATIPVLGVATAITMTRLHVSHGDVGVADSFPIPIWDMATFTTAFTLAALWRRRPDYHRRLMWIATCALTAAAWGRMPFLDHAEWFYVGVDALIVVAAVRDWIEFGAIHVVFKVAIPAIIAGQFLLAWLRWSPWWLHMAPDFFK